MPRKTFEQMLADMDYPPDVHEALVHEIARVGTQPLIEAGERGLPARQDAINWHDRMTGRAGMSDKEKQQEERIKALEAIVAELQGGQK